MNFNKKSLFLFLLLLILISCIGVVNATDVDNNIDNSTISDTTNILNTNIIEDADNADKSLSDKSENILSDEVNNQILSDDGLLLDVGKSKQVLSDDDEDYAGDDDWDDPDDEDNSVSIQSSAGFDEYGNLELGVFYFEDLTGILNLTLYNSNEVILRSYSLDLGSIDFDNIEKYNNENISFVYVEDEYVDITVYTHEMFPIGSYYLETSYADGIFDDFYEILDFNIDQESPELDFTYILNEYGELYVNATVKEGVEGLANFEFLSADNKKIIYSLCFENGSAYYDNVFSFKKGVYNLIISFPETETYFYDSKSETINFTKDSPNFDVDIDISELGGIVINATVVKAASGEVNFTVSPVGETEGNNLIEDVENGYAVFDQFVDFVKGTYQIVVLYSGDDNYYKGYYNSTVDVSKYLSKLDFNFTIDEYGYLTVDAKVIERATGIMTFEITEDSSLRTLKKPIGLVNGSARFNEKDVLNNGDYTISVSYSGDENYFSDYKVLSFISNKTSVNLVVVPSVDNSGSIIVDSRLNSSATGNIIFEIYNGTKLVANETVSVNKGIAKLNDLDSFAKGNYTIIATYSGDNKFYKVILNETVNVDKEIPSLKISPSMDDLSNLNILVSINKDSTGNIFLSLINEKNQTLLILNTINNGSANFNISSLAKGKYNIYAIYNGDNNYYSTISNSSYEITKDYPNLKISYDIEESGVIILNADIDVNASGNISFNIYNGSILLSTLSSSIKNGSASVGNISLTKGTYQILVNYTGDSNYYNLSENITINLAKDSNFARVATKIIFEDMITTAIDPEVDGREGEYFNVQLVDVNGKPLANKFVQIGFNGNVYNRTTNDSGEARLQINLKNKGVYTFAICYLGDDNYTGSFEVSKITVNLQKTKLTTFNKSFKSSAKTKTLTATFKSSRGNAIIGKKISFTVNGKTYSATTNSKGVATVKVSLSTKKTYAFTAKFAGDTRYAATSVSGKVTIK